MEAITAEKDLRPRIFSEKTAFDKREIEHRYGKPSFQAIKACEQTGLRENIRQEASCYYNDPRFDAHPLSSEFDDDIGSIIEEAVIFSWRSLQDAAIGELATWNPDDTRNDGHILLKQVGGNCSKGFRAVVCEFRRVTYAGSGFQLIHFWQRVR